jgi:hypothetical protein
MGEKINVYRIFEGKPEGKRQLGRPDVGGMVILKWASERYDWVVWTGFIWLRIGTSGGLL